MQKNSERIPLRPKKYIERIGLNNVKNLDDYFRYLRKSDSTIDVVYIEKKPRFQAYLDRIFKKTKNSAVKKIYEFTGDADFITDLERQELYRSIIKSGVHMEIMMDIDYWTLNNAKCLKFVGVDVMHQVSPGHYHFGVADSRMFSIFREPATPEALKIVALPQHEDLVNYQCVSTNQKDAVDYTTDLFKEFKKTATSFDERIEQLSRSRDNGNMTSDMLNR